MGLVGYWLRARTIRQWPRYLGAVVLLGLTLGASFTALAGARRTQSAYTRFVRWGHPSTLSMTGGTLDDAAVEAKVRRFPEVVRSASYVSFSTFRMVDGRPQFAEAFEPVGTLDGRYYEQDRFVATHGRTPDPSRIEEVAVNEFAAEQYGYRVGQQVDLATFATEQTFAPDFFSDPPPPKVRTHATIVGVGLFPDEVLQDDGDRSTRMLLTPALTRTIRRYANYSLQGVVLAHGDADLASVERRYATLQPQGTSIFRVNSVDDYHALAAVRPLSIALAIFGLIAGAAGVVLGAQALARLVRSDRAELGVLRALGVEPAVIARAMVIAPLTTVAGGLLLAWLIALAASPSMPVGPVRRVEVARGFDLDATVLGLGALVAAVVLLGVVLWSVRAELPHRSRQARLLRSPSRVVAAASSSGAPPTAVLGLRFALEAGDDVSAVSARSVIANATVALAALVAAITFGTSLTNLVHHPHLYGWTWDVAAIDGLGYGNFDVAKAERNLYRDRQIAAWSGVYFGADTIGPLDVPLVGMAPGSVVRPAIVGGRTLQAADEIVLGTDTAHRLHKRLGDSVVLAGSGRRHTVRIVGLATMPTMGIVHGAHTSLGVGAVVAPALVPGVDRDITNTKTGAFGPNAILVRYRPGTDLGQARRRLRAALRPAADFAGLDVVGVQRPAEIVNSSSVGTVPALLAVALGAGAMVSLALALGASVRRRRGDLTVLKCLGFTRRQVAATIRWQATTTVLVSLLVGIPVGTVIGRALWVTFARHLHVVPDSATSPGALAAVALLALAVGNFAAILPAHRATRVLPTTGADEERIRGRSRAQV